MAYLRTDMHSNGDSFTGVEYYTCNLCQKEICEMWPHCANEEWDHHLCWDCAFMTGKIPEDEYVKYGCGGSCNHAAVINGKIVLWNGKHPPWEQDQRKSSEYKQWRIAILSRDNYICQDCGQRGGELNAHHIKSWAQYEELRFDTNNGITLCLECHKKVHKKKVG